MPFMDLPVRTELSIKNQFIIADSVFFGKRCSIYKVPVRGQKAARSEKNLRLTEGCGLLYNVLHAIMELSWLF